jgi:hypothetical protein
MGTVLGDFCPFLASRAAWLTLECRCQVRVQKQQRETAARHRELMEMKAREIAALKRHQVRLPCVSISGSCCFDLTVTVIERRVCMHASQWCRSRSSAR